MRQLPNPLEHRQANHLIETLFVKRWSARAMSGEAIHEPELQQLFEAARWAPSTYNEQEWRFLYARRDTEHFATFMDLLVEFNQQWCKNAAVLMVLASHKVFTRNGKPNPVHSLDAGAAWENLALQATAMGLVVHGMGGFDRDKTRQVLEVPDDYAIEMMIAVGRPGDPDQLPEDLRKMEVPSGRIPIQEMIREGKFTF